MIPTPHKYHYHQPQGLLNDSNSTVIIRCNFRMNTILQVINLAWIYIEDCNREGSWSFRYGSRRFAANEIVSRALHGRSLDRHKLLMDSQASELLQKGGTAGTSGRIADNDARSIAEGLVYTSGHAPTRLGLVHNIGCYHNVVFVKRGLVVANIKDLVLEKLIQIVQIVGSMSK